MKPSPVRTRLASYALILCGLFATAYTVGERAPGHSHGGSGGGGHHHGLPPGTPLTDEQLGLSDTAAGYRLVLADWSATSVSLRVEGPSGPVTDFVEAHGARLHLFVIRHDLSEFQHLHPEMAADGTWSIGARIDQPGGWRVVVEAQPVGETWPVSLGTNLTVPGDVVARALPLPDDSVDVEGLTVTRSNLRFRASPRAGLQPYLGQAAHLVAFRQTDLAYVHIHPENDTIGDYRFSGSLPGPGTYRLYLQFMRNGEVVTVPFTVRQ